MRLAVRPVMGKTHVEPTGGRIYIPGLLRLAARAQPSAEVVGPGRVLVLHSLSEEQKTRSDFPRGAIGRVWKRYEAALHLTGLARLVRLLP